MKISKNKNSIIAAVIGLLLVVIIMAAGIASQRASKETAEPAASAAQADTALAEYWQPDSAAAQSLREYVAKVTNPADKANFIPEKDRIAVFDMDGTLICETFYTYYDTMMFIDYCLRDHPENVPEELKEVAASIKPGYKADESLARNFARAFAGMTVEAFYEYASEFGRKNTQSFTNMHYSDCSYLPMVELVKYLCENDFTIYVISGTERTTSRAIIANSPFSDYVTPNHVIGTDFEVKQKGFEQEKSNMDYKYEDGSELVLTGGFIQKNLNGNKSVYIEREIGQRPVLAFGNSGSDTSMMNYTIDSRNPYPAEAYMVVADDDVREWGTQDWTEKSTEYKEQGYVPVSMKDDFAQIYPKGIEKAAEQYQEPEADVSEKTDTSEKADASEKTDASEKADASDQSDTSEAAAQVRTIKEIREAGVLRIGTTGDYQPMSFLNPETKKYEGFDISIAEDLAEKLGVNIMYVETTWPTLMEDTCAGKFDLAICGITVTDERKEQALMSDGYFGNGKTVLCRKEDADKYTSLDEINRPEVRVMENPGGLNEKFVRENLPDADLTIHDVNQEIPGLIAEGKADVMITEIMEAGYYAGKDSRLAAPLIYEPFTQGQLGVLMPKGSEELLDYTNNFLKEEKESGRIDELAGTYIYQNMDESLETAA